jgi:hypothetical protein
MTARSSAAIWGCGVLLACVANPWSDEETVHPESLAEGTYGVAYGQGLPAADEAALLAVTAKLDRTAGQLVFTMADGSQQTLAFAPRPIEQWQGDCATMSGHALDEVADLSPAPLRLESLSFATPLVFAKCGPARMILADTLDPSATTWLAFDLR